MHESPVFDVEEIAKILHERLGATVEAAYLYGSVARGCRTASDLDLLFVTALEDQSAIFAAVADIQISKQILIHPTVISPRELQSNPLFRELVDSAIVLWRNVTTIGDQAISHLSRSGCAKQSES